MDAYYANGLDTKYGGTPSMYTASAGANVSESNIKSLFSKYASSNGTIDGEGIEKFFGDIDVDMMDPVTLVIMHSMDVKESDKVEYAMFKKGCDTFKADSIPKWNSLKKDLARDL
jgi:hypothetical protein